MKRFHKPKSGRAKSPPRQGRLGTSTEGALRSRHGGWAVIQHQERIMSKKLAEIAVGDFVLRWFGGIPKPMRLKVTQLTADRIICGAWEFDRQTGAEIDEDLG